MPWTAGQVCAEDGPDHLPAVVGRQGAGKVSEGPDDAQVLVTGLVLGEALLAGLGWATVTNGDAQSFADVGQEHVDTGVGALHCDCGEFTGYPAGGLAA